jgi:peptide subunit release factor RF-3
MRVFPTLAKTVAADDEIVAEQDELARRYGDEYATAAHEIDTGDAKRRLRSTLDEFLAGRQTPVFFGSAINNFGVREVLEALVDIAPPPAPRQAISRVVRPDEPHFFRGRVQAAGQHGSGASRPHRVRAGLLRPVRARHEVQGAPYRQGVAADRCRHLPVAAARPASTKRSPAT